MSQHELVMKVHTLVSNNEENLYSKLYDLYNECGGCEFMEAVCFTIKGFAEAWDWANVETLSHEVKRIEENENSMP